MFIIIIIDSIYKYSILYSIVHCTVNSRMKFSSALNSILDDFCGVLPYRCLCRFYIIEARLMSGKRCEDVFFFILFIHPFFHPFNSSFYSSFFFILFIHHFYSSFLFILFIHPFFHHFFHLFFHHWSVE